VTETQRTRRGKRGLSLPFLPIAVIIGSVIAIGGLILLERDEAGEEPAPSATVADPGSTFLAGSVTPGAHAVSVFDPPLTLTITEGWNSPGPPDEDQIILDGPGLFVITRVSQVWDNEKQENVPLPGDLIDWFRKHKDFRADEPVNGTIGGRPARQMDMVAVETVDTIHFPPAEHLRIRGDDRTRITVIDVDGVQIAAVATVGPAEFETAIAQTQPIVDSLQFFPAEEDAG
jgi:hypothetical protein